MMVMIMQNDQKLNIIKSLKTEVNFSFSLVVVIFDFSCKLHEGLRSIESLCFPLSLFVPYTHNNKKEAEYVKKANNKMY